MTLRLTKDEQEWFKKMEAVEKVKLNKERYERRVACNITPQELVLKLINRAIKK